MKAKKITNAERTQYLEQIEEVAQYRAKIDHVVAETAHAVGFDREIAEAIQYYFGFKANTWKHALDWFGAEWSEDALTNTALLYCASLSSKLARQLHDEWQRNHLSLSQLRERRAELNPRKGGYLSPGAQCAALVAAYREGEKTAQECVEMLALFPFVKRALGAK